jgi:hypothetical protein
MPPRCRQGAKDKIKMNRETLRHSSSPQRTAQQVGLSDRVRIEGRAEAQGSSTNYAHCRHLLPIENADLPTPTRKRNRQRKAQIDLICTAMRWPSQRIKERSIPESLESQGDPRAAQRAGLGGFAAIDTGDEMPARSKGNRPVCTSMSKRRRGASKRRSATLANRHR